jgi:glutaconyl-CoA/methylmalonyl-CoA decarboxylase subunit gamma
MTVSVNGIAVPVAVNGRRGRRTDEAADAGSGPQQLTAPMPGKVLRVLVKPGDVVDARQPLVVIEAMKMENELRAGRGGTISEVHAREGRSVDAGALLLTIQ